MDLEQLQAKLAEAQQESANLDYRRLQLQRQIKEARQEITAIERRMAYLKGRAELLGELGQQESG